MIEIKKIQTKAEIGKFIDFRTELYRDDPCACPYLFSEEMADLYQGSRDAQPYWEYCEAEYYMAYKDGKAVGRIAAIINHRANKKWNHKNVRFGYFDFIDDYDVSEALIKKVEEYGLSKGMNTIIGPMGFIDLGREGMLIEGFDYEQTMHANHNFPYYREHMEALGFTKDNDWVQNMVKVPDAVPGKFVKIANLINTRYGLHAKKMTKKEAIELGLGHRLFEVLNKCYQDLYEFSEIDNALIERMVKSYVSFADMNLVTLICDKNKNDEIVGFGVTFPSFTKALRKTDRGRVWPFGWIGLLKTLYTKWFHYSETVDLLIIGVLPEYRSKGANALLFNDLIPWYQKYHFKQALTLAMMETNDGVLSAWQYLDAKTVKRLRSYKKKLL